MEKELIRNGKRFKVNIPTGAKRGSRIKLRATLETTNDLPGDIVISISVK